MSTWTGIWEWWDGGSVSGLKTVEVSADSKQRASDLIVAHVLSREDGFQVCSLRVASGEVDDITEDFNLAEWERDEAVKKEAEAATAADAAKSERVELTRLLAKYGAPT